jgi:isovaleryl-CoA dehydrogenase
MSEAGSGSDVMSMRTRAEKKGDRFRAERHQVLDHQRAARRHPGGLCPHRARAGGITAFLIEKGMKGFSVSKKLDKMGMRGSDTAELVFEDCEVPEENVMGPSAAARVC